MLDLEPIRARIVALAKWDTCHREDDADDEANDRDERVFRICAPGDIAALIEEAERLRAELAQTQVRFIVRLEPGVWIAAQEGDPGRTTVKASARRFDTERSARRALSKARRSGQYPRAVVERV